MPNTQNVKVNFLKGATYLRKKLCQNERGVRNIPLRISRKLTFCSEKCQLFLNFGHFSAVIKNHNRLSGKANNFQLRQR